MKHEQVATKWRIANVSGTREHEVWSVPYQQLRAKDLLTLTSYDEEKNKTNLKKHGLPLSVGARVFFDDYRVELDDIAHSDIEQRYDVIGSSSAGIAFAENEEILFVVYTERDTITQEGSEIEVTRLISVRLANSFERGVYYANRR